MNKFKNINNQELLTEVEQRIPVFTHTDLVELMKVLGRQRQRLETFYQAVSPEFSQWYQKASQEVMELKKKRNWKVKL